MLSRSSQYALRAVVYIHFQNRQQKRPGIIEIAKKTEAPAAFIAKILQSLVKQGFLNSMKGRGGGFFITDDQAKRSLYDLMLSTEGTRIFHSCGFGLRECSDQNPCPLHFQYKAVRDEFLNIVKSETIASLATKVLEGKAVLNRLPL